LGGVGGNGFGRNGGIGGAGGDGLGGGIFNLDSGVLTIDPRLGARKGSRQSRAANLITANQANAGSGNSGGAAGLAMAGAGGSLGGVAGHATPGVPGTTGTAGTGMGGGLCLVVGGTVLIDNTQNAGNQATTSDPDVFVTKI
jgi:hypothetical protein